MIRLLLLLAILATQIDFLTEHIVGQVPNLPLIGNIDMGGQVGNLPYSEHQSEKPLTQPQIESLLKVMEDENLANEIRRKGIDFRLTEAISDRLRKLGTREKTTQALEEKEEQKAFEEFSTERNPARRIKLGQEFSRRFPRSSNLPRIVDELKKAELDQFESEFQAYADGPSAAGLEKVLALGRDLRQRNPSATTVVLVTSKLAVATSLGMIGNFYNDLEQSREYANQALKLLESPAPPEMDPQAYAQLRAASLSQVYQSLGLYQLRQSTPDPDQAISLLTRAIDLTAGLKDGPGANDSIACWLRAMAREMKLQKLGEQYRLMTREQRTGRAGQTLCSEVTTLINQMIQDYAQVIALSARGRSSQFSQLRDQAIEAINLLATGDRPCVEGRPGLIDKLPAPEKRFALVIGVEDHLDKTAGKLNYAASDAREFANLLVQLGGFRKEQVILLATGEAADRQPMRSVILQQLAELPGRVQPDGLLLIYFVGLGAERNGKPYLLAADSLAGNDSLLAETAIGIDRFREFIRASGAGQIMLFLDAFRRAPAGEDFATPLTFDIRKNEATAFATFLAAGAGQKSYESPASKHGVFTAALLDGARGKAAGKNRVVTLEDLIQYLQNNVPKEARRESSAEQSPQANVAGYEKEDLVLFQPTSGPLTQSRPSSPSEMIRASKTINVRPKTVYMDDEVLITELRKLPEFEKLNLTIEPDPTKADLVIEIKLPFLSWEWNYHVLHRANNASLLTGKLRGMTDNSVSPAMAKDIVTRLLELRDAPAK